MEKTRSKRCRYSLREIMIATMIFSMAALCARGIHALLIAGRYLPSYDNGLIMLGMGVVAGSSVIVGAAALLLGWSRTLIAILWIGMATGALTVFVGLAW